ncbi:MAG: transcriptional repressor [Emcibacteraceae bacterium]|nr:transcriptional repressor [Emcibacteraceae bacterium]MDG1858968.1 transcriptional repressor [Emcibacteraceae bacterium]
MSRLSVAETSSIVNINQGQTKALNSYRLTSNQRMVYETLLNLGRSAGAYELLDMLRKKGVNAAATVYRALNELAKKGLVKRIVSTRTFVAHQKPKAQDEESLMLICKHCGEVSSIDDQKLVGLFDKNISQSGYQVNSYHLELIVSCDSCNKKELN